MTPPLLEASGLGKLYEMPAGRVVALRDFSIEVAQGDYVAIEGPSGSGKSTLLHLLACVDVPSEGRLSFRGRDTAAMSDAERSYLRLRHIGLVFQRFFLLPMLTAWENVEFPQAEARAPRGERRRRTAELLDYVGLAHRGDHLPSQLSGGEMQRVAIARALANRPALLLADEPTGELDRGTSEEIASLFDRVHRDGTAIVLVTHDADLAARSDRRLQLSATAPVRRTASC